MTKKLHCILRFMFLFSILIGGTFPLKANAAPSTNQPRILFIGNSLTSYNKMSTMFSGLCEAAGYAPKVATRTKGGYLLEYHADPTDDFGAKVYNRLTNYSWDYVILQDQRYTPMTAPETSTFPASRTLNSLIKKAGGETVFYMTWGFKTNQVFTVKGVTSTLTMQEIQNHLADGYFTIGNELNALVSPVGISFMRCVEQYPEIELWRTDGFHPSAAGSYLAACTLFATIFEQSPLYNSYHGGLDAETAEKLQIIANRRLVLDNSHVRLEPGNSKSLSAQILYSPETEPEPETEIETEAESETESEVEIETNAEFETEFKTEIETESETENEPLSELERATESETESEIDINTIIWSSSNPDVVSVDPNTGVVTAHSLGMALITASTPDGLVSKCNVYSEIFARTLTLSAKNLNLTVGSTYTPTYTYSPANATDTFRFSSSNEAIASVTSSGMIWAISPGTATITLTGSNGISADIKVTATLSTPEQVTVQRAAKKSAKEKLTNINVSWKSVAHAKKYDIYRSTTKNGSYKKVGSSKETQFVDTGCKVGKKYFYKVIACAGSKSCNSSFSTAAKIRVPATPQLTTTRKGKKRVFLKWKKVKYASGYEIYRSQKKGGTYSLLRTIKNGKKVKFTDKSLKKNRDYYYKIRAYISIDGRKIYSQYSAVIKSPKY